MQILAEFFGFATLTSGLWNAAAYAAFIGIIVGVLYERYRNTLFAIGAATLALYAGVFLQNSLFTALQMLVFISALLQWTKVSKRKEGRYKDVPMVTLTVLAIVAGFFLLVSGAIVDVWALVGSFGLLGIAFGLAMLPRQNGFLVMAVGGVLLVFYAFAVEVWVFFFLNIFFALANSHKWNQLRTRKAE